MTVFKATCILLECECNKGARGTNCMYRQDGVDCMHPRYKHRWAAAVELAEASVLEVAARGLTARAAMAGRASVEMLPAEAVSRACQLALELGGGR